jgi:hypothetical protein
MTASPCDYMDDLNHALGISLDTDDVEVVTDAALAEVRRLQTIEKLVRDGLDRIIGALSTVQDIDDENGHANEAKAGRDLIDQLQALPDPSPNELVEDDEEDDDE